MCSLMFFNSEKQLLCLARAILKRSKILVMDEVSMSGCVSGCKTTRIIPCARLLQVWIMVPTNSLAGQHDSEKSVLATISSTSPFIQRVCFKHNPHDCSSIKDCN